MSKIKLKNIRNKTATEIKIHNETIFFKVKVRVKLSHISTFEFLRAETTTCTKKQGSMNIRIDSRRNKKVKVHSRQSIFKKDHLWLIGNLHMNETTVKQFIMKVSYCVY